MTTPPLLASEVHASRFRLIIRKNSSSDDFFLSPIVESNLVLTRINDLILTATSPQTRTRRGSCRLRFHTHAKYVSSRAELMNDPRNSVMQDTTPPRPILTKPFFSLTTRVPVPKRYRYIFEKLLTNYFQHHHQPLSVLTLFLVRSNQAFKTSAGGPVVYLVSPTVSCQKRACPEGLHFHFPLGILVLA